MRPYAPIAKDVMREAGQTAAYYAVCDQMIRALIAKRFSQLVFTHAPPVITD